MNSPINKSNIRRPLITMLLFIILLVASNLFISSISQFFIVNREIDNIGKYYRSIGSIRSLDENNYDVKEAQELITGDLMIDFEDIRRITGGLIDEAYIYKRNSNRFRNLEGYDVYDLIFIGEIREAYKTRDAVDIYEGSFLKTKLVDLLAGIPDFVESDSYYKLYEELHFIFGSHSVVTGEKFEYINDDVIDALYELEPGKKYLFRTFVEPEIKAASFAKPLYDDGPLYIELDENGYIDWDDPQFKIIKEEMDFINESIISYHLTGTKDMTAMAEIQDSSKDYYLVEGRWINKEDYENENHVVVIHETLAKNYEINIGDKLDIKMRDSEEGYGLFFTEKDHSEWKTYYTSEPKSFEVVGIFESNVYPQALYSNIYVPDSTIPAELGRYTKSLDEFVPIDSSLYNFVLKNADDESNFIEKYKEPLKKLGYELSFLINNVEGFLESTTPIKRSTAMSSMIFTMLLILIQGFVVYIYVDGHKLNYAIERALGIPSKISGRHLIQPLIISGIISSIIGGYIGYNNAIEKSMELLGELPVTKQATVNSGLDIKYLLLFIFLSMIPFVLILIFRTNQLKNSSVIDLINNNKKKKKKVVQEEIGSYEMAKATTGMTIENEVVSKGSESIEEQHIKEDKRIAVKDGKKALRRFSLNNTLRSIVTSMLLIGLAGILTFSLLWINYLTNKNNDSIENAYKEYIVTGDIVARGSLSSDKGTGPISERHIGNLSETEMVEDYRAMALMIYDELYVDREGVIEKYEIGEKDKIHYHIIQPKFIVNASNKNYNSDHGDIELTELNLIDGYSLEDFYKVYSKSYPKGFDPIIINENGEGVFPILVSNKAMEYYDLELEDKILLKPALGKRKLLVEAYGTIVGTFTEIKSGKDFYGYSTKDEGELFIYPISALEVIEGEVYYNKIEFTFKPDKNKELIERKEEIREIISNNPSNELATELRLWDGELTNVIEPLEKNLSLLEVLYPVTFILSVILAGILAFMIVLRRTLDVSILRILGVKEREVQWNLFRENLMLVLIGIGASCIIVFTITSNSLPIDLRKYAMVCGGYLLGTIVGLILGIGRVTNKKPLEMLQAKE